jgi:hypothetical protein
MEPHGSTLELEIRLGSNTKKVAVNELLDDILMFEWQREGKTQNLRHSHIVCPP